MNISLSYTVQGAGPPLVLLHGLMVTGKMFEQVTEELAARYQLIIPDLRGHGKSRRLPTSVPIRTYAHDLSLLLSDLKIDQAVILGYSHGGAIAQQFAFDHPEKCTRLILVCTWSFNMATLGERIEGYLTPALIRVLGMKRFARLVVPRGMKTLNERQALLLYDMISDQDAEQMINGWKAARAFDSRPYLEEIKCPTLIIAGSRDQVVPKHHISELHRSIDNSDLIILNGADHALIFTHPDEFVRQVELFLTSRFIPSAPESKSLN